MVIWVSQAKHIQNLPSHLQKPSCHCLQLILSKSHLHECTGEVFRSELLLNPVYTYSSDMNYWNVHNAEIMLVNWTVPGKIPRHRNSVTPGDTLLVQSLCWFALGQLFQGTVQELTWTRDTLFQKFSECKCRWGLVWCQVPSMSESTGGHSDVYWS